MCHLAVTYMYCSYVPKTANILYLIGVSISFILITFYLNAEKNVQSNVEPAEGPHTLCVCSWLFVIVSPLFIIYRDM